MRTIFLAVLLFAVTLSTSFAQWFPLYSGTKENLYAIHFSSAQNGLAGGSAGTLLKTNDGGQTWQAVSLSINKTLYSIFSTGRFTFVAGEGGTILKSSDRFVHWDSLKTRTSLSLHSLFFIDSLNGWAAADSGQILRSQNGGQTWRQMGSGQSNSINSLFFTGPDTGLAVGNFGLMLATFDAGMHWKTLPPITTQNLHAINFYDTLHGLAVGDSGCVLRTEDGGASWIKETPFTDFNLYALALTDSLHFRIAAGLEEQGLLLSSMDGGQSWSQLSSNLFGALYTVNFLDAYLGFSAGRDGRIVFTQSGGLSSASRPFLQAPLNNQTIEQLQVRLKWSRAENAESYRIQIAADMNFHHILIDDSLLTGLEYPLNALAHQTLYYWRVRAVNVLGSGLWSSVWHFKTFADGPQLLSPTAGESNVILPLSLSWRQVEGSEKYWLQVATNSDFTNKVINDSAVTQAAFTTDGLNYRQEYFWRVKFKKENIFSDWSVPGSFITFSGLKGWTRQWSPTSSTLNDVFFIGKDTGWIVGSGGRLLKTTNGGAYWQLLSGGTSNNLEAVMFLNDSLGWVAGWSGAIRKTTDGGASWVGTASNTNYILRDIYFSDAQHGWAVGEKGLILKSSDGGETWQINSDIANNEYYEVHFSSPDTGWIVGNNWNGTENHALILRTYNGGTIWTAQNFSMFNFITSLSFISPTEGWAAGTQGGILHTVDGGLSWRIQYSNNRYAWYAVSFSNARQGWVVGMNGACLHTEDGGTTWTAQTTGTRNSLRSVRFGTGGVGWAVGNYGTILQTSSSGFEMIPQIRYPSDHAVALSLSPTLCWYGLPLVQQFHVQVAKDSAFTEIVYEKSDVADTVLSVEPLQKNQRYYWRVRSVHENQYSAWSDVFTFETGGVWVKQAAPVTADLNDVFFCNIQQGIVVGDRASILKTDNGGLDWRKIPVDGKSNLYSVFFTDGARGWAVGDSGRILKTENSGESWASVRASTDLPLKSVYFVGPDTGWVVGGGRDTTGVQTYSVILKTTDGGETWFIQMRDDPAYLNDVFFLNAAKGWVVGNGGEKKILTSNDGGLTWATVAFADDIFVNKIYFQNEQTGYLGGTSGKLYRTFNGGQTWQALAFPGNHTIKDFYFSREGQAVVLANGIFSSNDSGATWQVNFLNGSENFNALTFASDRIGWVVGSNGLILKTSTAGFPVSISSNVKSTLPEQFALFQNYPNPFNAETAIGYYVKAVHESSVHIELTVYNTLGQKVCTLVNKNQKPGKYRVIFNGGNLASGIYIYRLKTSKAVVGTKKCILLK